MSVIDRNRGRGRSRTKTRAAPDSAIWGMTIRGRPQTVVDIEPRSIAESVARRRPGRDHRGNDHLHVAISHGFAGFRSSAGALSLETSSGRRRAPRFRYDPSVWAALLV